jgi:nicotinamidase-related amidase
MATPMNVLVVIDVQNCFMFHNDGMTAGKGGTFLNAGEEASREIVSELETLVDDKTHVVFSRDFHPVNHISLEGYEGRQINPDKGVWPKHCRNKSVRCGARIGSEGPSVDDGSPLPNNVVNTTTGELVKPSGEEVPTGDEYLPVIGTELSYMFFKSEKLRGPVKELTLKNRIGENKIGLNDTMNESIPEMKETPPDSERTPNSDQPPLDKKYITLTKGERCDKEAYSAFNYHIVYDSSKPSDPVKSNIKPDDATNSTGLWEWILKNRDGKKEITITVCGLVGNVCVMHSLLQGIALWNNVYSKLPENEGVKVKFVYSLKGTRFAEGVPDGMPVKPESFDDKVVEWFNQPYNRPDGMGSISVTDPASSVSHSDKVTSFEVLDYDGKLVKIGTFAGPDRDGVKKLLMFSDIEGCQADPGKQSTFLCSTPFYDEIARRLGKDGNLEVAFLGDYFDQGLGVFNSIQRMYRLVMTFPGRVHIILGNRDVNKLRFMFELTNNVRGLTPNEKRWGVWSKYYDGLAGKTGVELVKHILSTSMGAGKSIGDKMVGLHSFVPVGAKGSASDEIAYNYLLAAFGLNDSKPDFTPLDLLGFFSKCKIAHVFNGKVLLAHGGGFDPQAFFGTKYVESFFNDVTVTGENYHQLLNDFRVRLSSLPEDDSYHVSVEDSVNVYNNLLQEVLGEVSKGEFTWKFVLLQALGLKPDSEDARYKSLIQSCSQDGCSGKNEDLKYDPGSTKLKELLERSGITHVSYGHKPICFPIPVIYQRKEVPGVTFISNDTSNGNRKVEEIGENTAIGTMVIFDKDGVKSKIEPVELNGREAKVGNYSAMYDPLTLDTTPFYKIESGAYVLKYGNGKIVFNKSGYNQLNYIGSSNSGGKRRSRHRKQHKSKRGSKRGGYKKTIHRKHKHTKRGRKARK